MKGENVYPWSSDNAVKLPVDPVGGWSCQVQETLYDCLVFLRRLRRAFVQQAETRCGFPAASPDRHEAFARPSELRSRSRRESQKEQVFVASIGEKPSSAVTQASARLSFRNSTAQKLIPGARRRLHRPPRLLVTSRRTRAQNRLIVGLSTGRRPRDRTRGGASFLIRLSLFIFCFS